MTRNTHHATIPASACYWAIIDERGTPRPLLDSATKRRQRLGYAFEESLPVPIDGLHAVYANVAPGKKLACAVEPSVVERAVAEVPNARTLIPDAVPDFVGEAEAHARLNLLVGPHEPRRTRVARRLPWLFVWIGIVAVTTLVITGLERRTDAAWQARIAADAITTDLFADLFEGSQPSAQPLAIRLISELRERRQQRGQSSADPSAPKRAEAAHDLALVLQHWPRIVGLRLETLTVASDAVSFVVVAPDAESVGPLKVALDGTPGYRLAPSSVQNQRGAVRVTLRLLREDTP